MLGSNGGPHLVFGPACYAHGMLASSLFWSEVRINDANVTAQSQLLSWLFDSGKKLDGVSSCDGVGCDPGCPPIDKSDEATECVEVGLPSIT